MLIDCDTCTVRGQGCDDCVVTVLLGAPPGWGSEPTVVPLSRRRPGVRAGEPAREVPGRVAAAAEVGGADDDVRPVVELDDVERNAVRALADFGLVPPLRHQDATTRGDRHVS
ncbi:hypothetical protein [Modestobacter lacusdianchii]